MPSHPPLEIRLLAALLDGGTLIPGAAGQWHWALAFGGEGGYTVPDVQIVALTARGLVERGVWDCRITNAGRARLAAWLAGGAQ